MTELSGIFSEGWIWIAPVFGIPGGDETTLLDRSGTLADTTVGFGGGAVEVVG
jgi:hypothetical protein